MSSSSDSDSSLAGFFSSVEIKIVCHGVLGLESGFGSQSTNSPFFSSTGAAAPAAGAAGAPAATAPPTGMDDSFSLPIIARKK